MNTHLFILILLPCASPFKMLVYIPKFAISHINHMGAIADTLVEAGHNVTALVSEIDSSLPDGTKKASILRVPSAEGSDHMNTHYMVGDTDMFEIDSDSYYGALEAARNNAVSFCRQCRKLLTTPGLIEQLKEEKYDAIITENFDNCGVGLSHLISARALILTSATFFLTPHDLGVHYSWLTEQYPSIDGRFLNTICARIRSLRNRYILRAFLSTQNTPLQSLFDEICPGTPTFSELVSNAAVIFPNTEPLISITYPSISKIVPIGGITVGKPKPLDEHWSALLSLRSRTVLVSFGSIAKSVNMRPARKTAMLEAFASFPDTTFIWKYESITDSFSTSQASKVENVVLVEWTPQTDLLADPRLSLFISHGGMSSCHELTTFGVPTLFIPLFSDGDFNAAALTHIGAADVFNKYDMTDAEKLREAIGKMLSDPSYKSAATRLRDQLASRPITPAKQLVSHVEFAARFGPSKALRPLSLDLTLIQFWGIDLALIGATWIVCCILVLYIVIASIRSLCSAIQIREMHRKSE